MLFVLQFLLLFAFVQAGLALMIYPAVSSLACWLIVTMWNRDKAAFLIFYFFVVEFYAEFVDVESPNLKPVVVVPASRVQLMFSGM